MQNYSNLNWYSQYNNINYIPFTPTKDIENAIKEAKDIENK